MKVCSKCGEKVGNANKSGICTKCQRPTRFGLPGQSINLKPGTKVDPDDEVLARVDVKPPPPAKVKKAKAPPAAAGDVEEFFTLASALGLEPQAMLDGWCREWVEKIRTRALIAADPASELAAAIELVERAAATPKPETPAGD